jgi:hypothetical protein
MQAALACFCPDVCKGLLSIIVSTIQNAGKSNFFIAKFSEREAKIGLYFNVKQNKAVYAELIIH